MKKAMRQIAGAFAELEKARLVSKLRGPVNASAPRSKRSRLTAAASAKGRKNFGELRPN